MVYKCYEQLYSKSFEKTKLYNETKMNKTSETKYDAK